VKILESFKDLFRHRDSLGLHFNHKWFMHFGCANRFSGLCHFLWMRFYFKTWHISMIFFSWETHKLHWAYCPHLLFIDLISLEQYHFIFFPNFFNGFQ
jgi:hypothetical protein